MDPQSIGEILFLLAYKIFIHVTAGRIFCLDREKWYKGREERITSQLCPSGENLYAADIQ